MKRLLFIILVSLLQPCSGQIFFNNFYKAGSPNTETSHTFQNPWDSSFTVFSYGIDSTTGNQALYLLNLNKTGVLNFKKALVYPFDYYKYQGGLKQFIPATASSYFATGTTYTATNNTVLFAKINKITLDTIKTSYYYDGQYSYYFSSFLKFHDNKYLLIGNKSNSTSQWPCAFQLDSLLNIVSTFTLNNPNNYSCAEAIYDKINSRILLSCRKLNSSNHTNSTLILCDTSLNIITSTTYSTNLHNGLTQMFYSGYDNTYLTLGSLQTSTDPSTYPLYRLQICKYDNSLNPVWRKTYGTALTFNELFSATLLNDGSLIACGKYGDSTAQPMSNYDVKGILLKINSNGDSLWMKQYNQSPSPPNPATHWETFFNINKTNDGGYIVCGTIQNQPQAKAWVLKIDSLGCVNAGCGSIITNESPEEVGLKDDIDVYPNPANDFIYLKTERSLSEEYSISLKDIAGKEILNVRCPGNGKINLAPLVPGLYFLNLYEHGNLISTKKIAVINN